MSATNTSHTQGMPDMPDTAAIWRDTLERLKASPMDAVSKTWLQSAYLTSTPDIGADDIDADTLGDQEQALYFTLQVPGTLARDIIGTRWRRSIEDALAEVTGQQVAITVTESLDGSEDDGYSGSGTSNGKTLYERGIGGIGGFGGLAATEEQEINYAYYDIPDRTSLPGNSSYLGADN